MGREKTPSKASAIRLAFRPGGAVEARPGESVLNAAWRGGIPLEAPCGGQGICGRCRVRLDHPGPPREEEKHFFSPLEIGDGWRLACRSPVIASTTAHVVRPAGAVPARTVIPRRRSRTLGPSGLGAAVDMGTTTLALQLWDLASGRLVTTATSPNPQASYGADVISRISSAARNDTRVRLGDLLRTGVSDLIGKAVRRSKVRSQDISAVVISGNTVMQHFFMGVDPSPLARTPFEPSFLRQPPLDGPSAGLAAVGDAVVHLVPCVSAFIGGDAVAGVLALQADGDDLPALLVDMGTNAEVVLIRKRSIVATSAAAGPALEGGNISNGLPAGRGAVERIDFSGDISLEIIGGGPPLGICGSGLLDLAALLLQFGMLTPDGRLAGAEEAAGSPWQRLRRRLCTRDGMSAFTVAPASGRRRAVTVTQEDFRELQLARSAIVTAWQLLLRKARMKPDDIRRIYLAGGYGYSLRRETLLRTGLLHPAWMDRLALAGNSSLAGASLMLLDRSLLEQAESVASSVRALHLAESVSFQKNFVGNLSFPEA